MEPKDLVSRGALQGYVVFITGASRGLGRAVAIACARYGALVAALSRDSVGLARCVEEIRQFGGKGIGCTADVSIWDHVKASFEQAGLEVGPVDVLINNAAVVTPVGATFTIDPQQWKKTLEINLLGAFYCSVAALEMMIPRRRGTIINLVSGMGERVFPYFGAYSVSKAGLIHFTRVLAAEVKPYGISVCGLDPGLVDTDMHAQLRTMPPASMGIEMHDRLLWYKREGILKSPDRVAHAIVGMLADGTMGMEKTGSIIHIG